MSSEKLLPEIREKIDAIDKQLQNLITERAKLAQEVGKIKHQSIEKEIFYKPEREAQILQQIIARNIGPLSTEQMTSIFRDILTACLSLQHVIKVATLGPAGTFSEAAVVKHFGVETQIELTTTIDDVFHAVQVKQVDYGVVPIENSTTGVINQVLDKLRTSELTICGEIILPIHHNLLRAHNAAETIEHVYAHEQALLQCQHWLAKNLPDARLISVNSNGEAAKRAEQDPRSAAIAGDFAAEKYALTISVNHIEDNAQNETRFLILGHQKVAASGQDKTSLLISTPHTPGVLIDLLKPFAENQINISLIASRPSRDCNWAYFFFIDIEGHQEDPAVKLALMQLAKQSTHMHVLGSYPKAVI